MTSLKDNQLITPAPKDNIERKRQLSDICDSTGVSPELKRQIISQGSNLTMPSDDATELEWHKTVYT